MSSKRNNLAKQKVYFRRLAASLGNIDGVVFRHLAGVYKMNVLDPSWAVPVALRQTHSVVKLVSRQVSSADKFFCLVLVVWLIVAF